MKQIIIDQPKYQYHVKTWGGFYNDEYKSIHGLEDGDFIFDTEEERSSFIETRYKIEKQLNARHLCIGTTEGPACNTRTVIHRIIEFEGKQYYSYKDLGINYPFDAAIYTLKYSWYPGFNDEPFGDDFDYDKVTIISEWVTGAFRQDD